MTFGKFVTREIKAEDIQKAIENAGIHQRLSGTLTQDELKRELRQAIDLATYGFTVTEVIKETGDEIRIDPRRLALHNR